MNEAVIGDYIQMAEEKLRNAKILFNVKAYNDTVSRAYYAVFHIISAMLYSKNLVYSSHGETIGNFNRVFIKSNILSLEYTKKIEFLFKARQAGDYDIIN